MDKPEAIAPTAPLQPNAYLSNTKSTLVGELAGAALYKFGLFMENLSPNFADKMGNTIEKVLGSVGLEATANFVNHATLDEKGNQLAWGDSYTVPVIRSKVKNETSSQQYDRLTKGYVTTENDGARNPQRKFAPIVKIKR